MFELHEVVIFVVWSVCIWSMGWYAGYDKRSREVRKKRLETAVKPSGVYLEDAWEEG